MYENALPRSPPSSKEGSCAKKAKGRFADLPLTTRRPFLELHHMFIIPHPGMTSNDLLFIDNPKSYGAQGLQM
jgi:hypothetical protein